MYELNHQESKRAPSAGSRNNLKKNGSRQKNKTPLVPLNITKNHIFLKKLKSTKKKKITEKDYLLQFLQK